MSSGTNPKYVLCRAQNGINDMFTQIERCCRYAEQHGRQVIVETDFCHTLHFKDRFSNYFVSRQPTLWFDSPLPDADLDGMSVFPRELKGQVSNHGFRRDEDRREYVETGSGKAVTFDFNTSYDEDVVVHAQGGGSQLSQFLPLRMRLHDRVADRLMDRLREIGRPYAAIHVRNTDMRTNYDAKLKRLAENPPPFLFVATDNGAVLEDFRARLRRTRVFSFSSLGQEAGRPLHVNPNQHMARDLNTDAILDLLTLASARKLHLCRALNAFSGNFSGFSLLARLLHGNRPLLKGFVERLDFAGWLDNNSRRDG